MSDSGARGPGFETYRRRVVSLSKTLYSPKVLVNYPGSDGSISDMTEKLLTGTLSLNTTNLLYPTIYFHACIHSPPLLGCLTLFCTPFLYSHYPFSLLHYHHIPPLNSTPLSYPSLAPPPLCCPIIPYHALPTLSSTPLPSFRLPSTPFPYAILPSHLVPYPIYPLLTSAPHPTSHQLPTPLLPFLTPLP